MDKSIRKGKKIENRGYFEVREKNREKCEND